MGMRSGLRTDLRAMARAEQLPEDLITASPKRRLIFSFNQTLKENVSMAQFQWKLGFVWIRTFLLPCFLPSQKHYLEVPGLNFHVCFCRSIILPLAWKNSSDPPCSVEQK